MESFIVSINAVAPVFFMMLLGYFLKGIHFFTDSALKQINALVFKVLLPIQLFRSSFQADLEEVVNVPFLLWNEALVLLSFAVLSLVSMRTVREPGKRGALLQGMFRGNISLVGMAIAEILFGENQTGTLAIVVAITVPVYNVLAVLALEMFQGGKMPVKRVAREIVTNPLIIGCALGAKLCRFTNKESLQVGVGMVCRGEVALIVANRGLELGVLTNTMMAPVIITVVGGTILTPIMLKLVFRHDDKPAVAKDSGLTDHYQKMEQLDVVSAELLAKDEAYLKEGEKRSES